MATPLEKYKDLIDSIVGYKGSTHYVRKCFKEKTQGSPHFQLSKRLSEQDRRAVLKLINHIAESATHDVLACLVEKEISMKSGTTSLPQCPFGTNLFEDWAARVQKLPWPDDEMNPRAPLLE